MKAAIFGAGCWASQYEPGLAGIACSISGWYHPWLDNLLVLIRKRLTGTGEHIIRSNLAQRLGEALRVAALSDQGGDPHDILNRILVDDFGGKEEALSISVTNFV